MMQKHNHKVKKLFSLLAACILCATCVMPMTAFAVEAPVMDVLDTGYQVTFAADAGVEAIQVFFKEAAKDAADAYLIPDATVVPSTQEDIHVVSRNTSGEPDRTGEGSVIFRVICKNGSPLTDVSCEFSKDIHISACVVDNIATDEAGNNIIRIQNIPSDMKVVVQTGEHTHVAAEPVEENLVPAGCETSGSYDSVVYCSVCNDEISRETITIQPTEHQWQLVDHKDASCTEDGYDKYVCENDERHVRTEPILSAGHIPGEEIIANLIPSSCTQSGSYDAEIFCTVCEEKLSSKHVVTDAAGHQPGEQTVENYVAADCTVSGSYDLVTRCLTCGEVISSEHVIEPATGHAFDAGVVTVEPSEEQDGQILYTCLNNSMHLQSAPINTTGHIAGEAVIENEHPATCEAQGSYDSVVYCTEPGCGVVLSRTTIFTDRLPHSELQSREAVPASCTQNGSHGYSRCMQCGYLVDELGNPVSEEADVIPMLAHTPGEEMIISEKPASCTESGEIVKTISCTECQTELSRTTETIPANRHTPGEAVRENDIPAGCESVGSYQNVVYCSDCNEELSRETIEVPAIGHNWGDERIRYAASCTQPGEKTYICQNNPAHTKTEVIPALGHQWGEPVKENETEATCDEDGVFDNVVRCTVCDIKNPARSVHTIIKAGGHQWDNGTAITEPTCIHDGLTRYTCKSNSSHAKTVTEKATGHTWDKYGHYCVKCHAENPDFVLEIVGEKELSYDPANGGAVTIVSNDDFSNFDGTNYTGSVLVDGQVLSPSQYTAVSGSVEVTLNDDYLQTLEAGVHDVAIRSAAGEAVAKLAVAEPLDTSSNKTSVAPENVDPVTVSQEAGTEPEGTSDIDAEVEASVQVLATPEQKNSTPSQDSSEQPDMPFQKEEPTEQPTEPPTQPVTQPTTQPATQPATKPVTQPTTQPVAPGGKVGPSAPVRTGDTNNPTLWLIIAGAAVAIAVGGILIITRKKKAEK